MSKLKKWFIKVAFPVIINLLKVYGEDIVRGLVKTFYTHMSEKEKNRAHEHFNQAKENMDKAYTAETEKERDEYKFQAEFYKQQAEQNINELQRLAKEFADLEEKTVDLVKDKTSRMDVEDLFKLDKSKKGISLKNDTKLIDVDLKDK
ncbi:hypothetical protein JNUCC1_00916 [Lentibacillus sp. JNUCC-1]|nr:hypothetical protein [Lentibacillus sp. JNUCC-1]